MGGFSITLLFTRNKNSEPGALISCSTSGEFFPYYFRDWKDAVHYINWSQNLKNDGFNEWCEQYGYEDDDECFNGDLNEFSMISDSNNKKNSEWTIFVHDNYIRYVDQNTDMNKISVWSDTIDINTSIVYDNDKEI
jgi:hypothetical protein